MFPASIERGDTKALRGMKNIRRLVNSKIRGSFEKGTFKLVNPSPIQYAVACQKEEVVSLFLSYGANPNDIGDSDVF